MRIGRLGGAGWPESSAALGFTVWTMLTALAFTGHTPRGWIESLFLLAALAIVPLGLGLVRPDTAGGLPATLHRTAILLQPPAALLVIFAFTRPAGVGAGLLVIPWAALGLLAAACGLFRVFERSTEVVWRASAAASLLFLAFGTAWLLFSRLGIEPAGIEEPIVLLTAVHFHYAGMAAPVVVGLAARQAGARSGRVHSLARTASISVIIGTPLLAAGWAFLAPLKLVGTLALVLGLALFAVLVPLLRVPPRSARLLLMVSALSALLPMAMALVYALGEHLETTWLGIPQMAVYHGSLNALGFSLCGLAGWTVAQPRTRSGD